MDYDASAFPAYRLARFRAHHVGGVLVSAAILPPVKSDRQRFRDLAMSAVQNCTEFDADAIADLCLEAKEAGGNSSIWYNAARHFGFESRCPCFDCCKARGES